MSNPQPQGVKALFRSPQNPGAFSFATVQAIGCLASNQPLGRMNRIIRVWSCWAAGALACSASRLAAGMGGGAADRVPLAGCAWAISGLKLLPPKPKIGVVLALTIKYVTRYEVR